MMETNVCPWCDTEIVWDEEFGPEDTCPHCNNELKGYRTVSLNSNVLEDELEEEAEPEEVSNEDDLWGAVDTDSIVPIFNTLDQFRDDHDLSRYEANVSAILAEQEEAPECPQCHELMLLAGTQSLTDFTPSSPSALGAPVMKSPFSLNVYICPSCFHVHQSLAPEDRIQLVRNLSIQN
ncbi:hypothetical protein PWYN_03850 [Paenibacillus wynnii]|uniref:Uncharacterized protein n=2 Tax=Paenibacillus wynnii TaxID=268407 RepID=A0A098M7N7_9BACL|nr:hypothetical protein PWYN_03850 [Paenibacillus wynnii]